MSSNSYSNMYKRNQESYSLLYGHGSSFLERHKQLIESSVQNNWTPDQLFAYNYSLGVRDILGLFNHPYIEGYKPKLSRFQIFSENQPSSFLDMENRRVENLPLWEFNLPNDPLPFTKQRVVKTSNKEDIFRVLKIFPDSFLITFDSQLVSAISLEIAELGILRKKDNYSCPLSNSKLEKAACYKLFGATKFDYLSNNGCYAKCSYLRDVQNCKILRIAVMRPFTFLTQIFKSCYQPRTLMVIDGMKGFMDSLRSYFSFTSPSFKNDYFLSLKTLIDSKTFKLKTYEKKGWQSLIKGLKETSPSDERFPSFRLNLFAHESESKLYSYLKKKGVDFIEGLSAEDFVNFCELKMDVFKMNLALQGKTPYCMRNGLHIPVSVDHIWKLIISKYAKYYLIVIGGK